MAFLTFDKILKNREDAFEVQVAAFKQIKLTANKLCVEDFKRAKKALKKARPKSAQVFWFRDMVANFAPIQETFKTFANSTGFIQALKRRGFVTLGSGYFSTVLGKLGHKRVIKVSHGRECHFDGWFEYIFWGSQKGYAGSFTPKVYSYKKVTPKNGQPFYVAVMERLKQTCHELDQAHKYKTVIPLLEINRRHENPMAEVLLDTVVPGMSSFNKKFMKSFRGFTDLSGDNIMVREDDSICLNDAVANYSSTLNIERLKEKDFISLSHH